MIPRFVYRFLARRPRLYSRLLRWSGRGSLEKRLFVQLVGAGQVICDIGANRGQFTLLFSELTGPKGEVHAFEPGPATFGLLEKALARQANCRLNNVALGESRGSAVLCQPGTDDGQASLRPHAAGSWSNAPTVEQHEIRMTTLDNYALSLDRLDFIKCDVEGAEMLVLRGARATLARFAPVLFLEVYEEWTRAFGYRPADLISFLVEAGYDMFFLVDESVRRIDPGTEIQGPANLLCARRGALPDVLES